MRLSNRYILSFLPLFIPLQVEAIEDNLDFYITANVDNNEPEYKTGQAVILRIHLKNTGVEQISIPRPSLFYSLSLGAVDERGGQVNLTGYGRRRGEQLKERPRTDSIHIKPGAEFIIDVRFSQLFDISLPGMYSVKAAFNVSTKEQLLLKKPLRLRVIRDDLEEVTEALGSTAQDKTTEYTNSSEYTVPAKDSKLFIELSVSIDRFNLGSTPFKIAFKNSSLETWALVRPEVSYGTVVHIREKGNPKTHKGIYPNGGYEAIARTTSLRKILLMPQQPRTVIKSADFRTFPLDLYTLGYDWKPGEYELWIESEQEKINSNLISFKLEVTADTVGLLLDMADKEPDSKDVLENRHQQMRYDFALNWLIKTFPDLPLNPITDRDDQSVVNAKYEQNHRFIADFRAKWPARKDTPEIKALFDKLNAAK